MKKFIVLGLLLGLTSSWLSASCEENVLRAPDAMALVNALMGIAGQLGTILPGLIQDIAQFPGLAQADALALQAQMKIAATLTGNAKQKKVQELFVDGVNLTVLVTNIINKLILVIASIGPLAQAIDANNGAKVNDALQLTATIMQMISKINIAMKNSIIAGGAVTVSAHAKETPKIDPIPDL